jgi:hypothetical protein
VKRDYRKTGKYEARCEERVALRTQVYIFKEKNMMRIISLVCAAFAAMTSIAQADPTIMKQSEPVRLTTQQMNNITAGGLTVITYASGTQFSYSRNIDFSIALNHHPGRALHHAAIAVACCGAHTTFTKVVVIPEGIRFDAVNLLANLFNHPS